MIENKVYITKQFYNTKDFYYTIYPNQKFMDGILDFTFPSFNKDFKNVGYLLPEHEWDEDRKNIDRTDISIVNGQLLDRCKNLIQSIKNPKDGYIYGSDYCFLKYEKNKFYFEIENLSTDETEYHNVSTKQIGNLISILDEMCDLIVLLTINPTEALEKYMIKN
jgi:hypothetical protein